MNRSKKTYKRPKYALGGTPISGYMTRPDDMIRLNQINLAKAQYEAENDPLIQAISLLSGIGLQAGMGAMSGGKPPASFANGGVVSGEPVKPFKKYTKKDVQKIAPRTGEYYLFDNSGLPSTHLMASGESRGKYYAYPTLFQNPKDSVWYQPEDPFREAMKRKELFEFPSEKEAQNFAEGSWKKMAYGGRAGSVPVEVEGKESAQMPNGQMLNFMGASHENGGMDINLPPATKIYSKRIKIDGVSMADRKNKRERRSVTLEKLLEKNKSDALIKNALGRTVENNAKEEQGDLEIQDLVNQMVDEKTGKRKKYQMGTPYWGVTPEQVKFRKRGLEPDSFLPPELQSALIGVDPSQPVDGVSTFGQDVQGLPALNLGTKTTGQPKFRSKAGIPTVGDIMGIAGNLYQGITPYFSTLAQRAQDTPNINAYENYGKESLRTLDEAKQYAEQVKDNELRDLLLATTATKREGRGSARSVNTLRALDLAAQQQSNLQSNKIYNELASRMTNILGAKSQMQAQRDQVVMGGEQQRDLFNRQDSDAYYSNLAKSKMAIGQSVTMAGKSVNDILERSLRERSLNQAYPNVGVDSITGEIHAKPGADYRVKNLVRAANLLTAKQAGVTDEEFLTWTPSDKYAFLTMRK